MNGHENAGLVTRTDVYGQKYQTTKAESDRLDEVRRQMNEYPGVDLPASKPLVEFFTGEGFTHAVQLAHLLNHVKRHLDQLAASAPPEIAAQMVGMQPKWEALADHYNDVFEPFTKRKVQTWPTPSSSSKDAKSS